VDKTGGKNRGVGNGRVVKLQFKKIIMSGGPDISEIRVEPYEGKLRRKKRLGVNPPPTGVAWPPRRDLAGQVGFTLVTKTVVGYIIASVWISWKKNRQNSLTMHRSDLR
jgi:hypothetical protein